MNLPWEIYNSKRSTLSTRFKFREVWVVVVFRFLKKLKGNKSTGLDSLPPGFLKDIAKPLSKPLCHVINASISKGVVPTDLKKGKIIPVYKSGSTSNIDNY